MILKLLPYNLLLMFSISASLMLTMNANNWLFMWVGLELNLLSFIPIILTTTSSLETEGAIKYFLTQAIASGMLLLSLMLLSIPETSYYPYTFSKFIIVMSLMMKLGGAPCHFWFPQVMNSINWSGCLLLTTVQKLNPLFLTIMLITSWNHYYLLMLIALNSFTGGVGGINQTQMRPLLAYSSISHLAWMLAISAFSISQGLIYFIIYMMILIGLFTTLLSLKKKSLHQFNILSNMPMIFMLMMFLNLLSLAGLPPLLGFIPKWMVINKITIAAPSLTVILILGSLLNLFYYLTIFFSSLLNSMKPLMFNMSNKLSPYLLITAIGPLFILLNMIYAMIMLY